MKSSFSVPFHAISELAAASGLTILGVSPATPKPLESSRLKIWQSGGNAAEMKYMQRDPQLQSDPLRLLPEARTVISVAVSYDLRAAPSKLPAGYGRVARYAWGKDYHLLLPERLNRLVTRLQQEYGDFKFRFFSDAVPLLERAFGASAGLGFIGKNTLLIRPKVGSFTLLAEILCDFEVTGFNLSASSSSCGTCSRCMASCPTGAFKSEYVLDARKCISYLSIEKRGVLTINERGMLGEWIFGCDVCQEVCPFNHGSLKAEREPDLQEFSAEFGTGPLINLSEVLDIKSQKDFYERYKDSPVLRPKREGIIRNAICVAVNTSVFEISAKLRVLALEDSSALVRQFAFWGYAELAGKESGGMDGEMRDFMARGLKDPELQVRAEVAELLGL